MFNFFVKYFGILKVVPFAAQLFDTQLRFWELLTLSPVPKYIDDIEGEVLRWPGVDKSVHKYGGLQFNFNGRELGHIHSNGLLDMRFSRTTKEQLLTEGRATEHHIFKKSGWISFYIRDYSDALYALELLERAFLQNSGRG
ncbi:luciferase domain-containing protein [Mucilaginibacter flavidus]|uniref:luciferase domain-containing protein n=1 Tax=Mucilaginibacter flavidus TaxID=2949309 RepID=UPI00209287EB|nr:luciferase family protein [Mucilaginibacter flavidus]MCO5948866.1 DUF5519 family protein [Mucilaginibacter flavidus]